MFAQARQDTPGVAFLSSALRYAHERLGFCNDAFLLRDRRDEKRASIRMRNCRRMRDERWA
jgi:hypothetical protein